MRVKERGSIYSVNEGYESGWEQGIRDYVHSKKYPTVTLPSAPSLHAKSS